MSKGKSIGSMLDMALEARMARAKEMGYDTDFPITHGSSSPELTEIRKSKYRGGEPGNIFDGVFGLHGDTGGVYKYNHTFYPRKDMVARSGDLDLDYETSISALKKEYPGASDEQLEAIYEISAGDKNIYDMDSNPLEDFGFSDLAEASWEGQRLRGRIADAHGYDAIEMSDEYGTSYLIPAGSKARKIDAAFDPEKKDSSNIMASVAPVGAGIGAAGYNALSPQQALAGTLSPTNPLAPSPQMLANTPYNKNQFRAPVAPMLLDVADKMQGYSDWRDKNLPAPVNWLLPFQPDPEYVRNRAYGKEPAKWEKVKFGLSFL